MQKERSAMVSEHSAYIHLGKLTTTLKSGIAPGFRWNSLRVLYITVFIENSALYGSSQKSQLKKIMR